MLKKTYFGYIAVLQPFPIFLTCLVMFQTRGCVYIDTIFIQFLFLYFYVKFSLEVSHPSFIPKASKITFYHMWEKVDHLQYKILLCFFCFLEDEAKV